MRAINRRSPIRAFVRTNLIRERGELAICRNAEILDRKLRGCRTAEQV